MIAQKNTLTAAMRKRGAQQLLPLSCLLASLPVLAEQPKELPKASETMVVTGTAMKVEVPMAETPRAVSVVNREELDQHAVLKLDEALRYRSGVLSQSYGSDNDADWFKVRGFDAASYLDGNRLFSTGYYVWTPEPFGLESVEVLKGPASILYGEAPPGGVINAISKRPTATPQGQLDLQMGSRDLRQIGVDVSDALTDNSRYRLVALYSERDGVLNDTYNDRVYLAPSVTLDISDRTSLTLLASFKHDEGVPTNGFFPVYGTLNTSGGQIDPSTNLSQPDYDRNRNTQISAGYELAHQLNQTWELSRTSASTTTICCCARPIFSRPMKARLPTVGLSTGMATPRAPPWITRWWVTGTRTARSRPCCWGWICSVTSTKVRKPTTSAWVPSIP